MAKYYKLEIEYQDKEHAKKAGAKWDAEDKTWYIMIDELHDIKQFNIKFNELKSSSEEELEYFKLDIEYRDKDRAKKAGAKWDQKNKSWYLSIKGENDIKAFILKFLGMEKEDELIKYYEDLRYWYFKDAINRNENADITIPDPEYCERLRAELEEHQKRETILYYRHYPYNGKFTGKHLYNKGG